MELPVQLIFSNEPVANEIKEDYVIKLVNRMRDAHEIAKRNIEASINKRCEKHNAKRTRKEFQVGDLVYLRNPVLPGEKLAPKFRNKWTGPSRITQKLGPVTFRVKQMHGKKEQVLHADRLKICKGLEGRTKNFKQRREVSDSEDELEENEDITRGLDIIEYPLARKEKENREDENMPRGLDIIEIPLEHRESRNQRNEIVPEIEQDIEEELQNELGDEENQDEVTEAQNAEPRRTRTRDVRTPEKFKDFFSTLKRKFK